MPEKNAGKTRKFLKEEITGSHLLLGDRPAAEEGAQVASLSTWVVLTWTGSL